MLCAVVLVRCKWLNLVVFGVLLLVLACNVWENLGKWNKMGVLCAFGSLSLLVLLCGAAAVCSLRSAVVHSGSSVIFTPPFFAFLEKIFEFASGLFYERL